MHAAPIELVSNGQHANLKRDTDVQDSLEYSKGLPFLVSQFVLVEIWKLLVGKKIVNCLRWGFRPDITKDEAILASRSRIARSVIRSVEDHLVSTSRRSWRSFDVGLQQLGKILTA
jgi:hypothetical protein